MSFTTKDYAIATLVAITMFVIESGLILLFPVTRFPFQHVFMLRMILAVLMVSGAFLMSRWIQIHLFNVGTDLDIFLTSFIIVSFEFVIFKHYALQGFNQDELDPFNKVLGKFIFTAISVMIAKGLYRKFFSFNK